MARKYIIKNQIQDKIREKKFTNIINADPAHGKKKKRKRKKKKGKLNKQFFLKTIMWKGGVVIKTIRVLAPWI